MNIASNPFSASFTQPGEVPFCFGPGESVEALVEKVRSTQATQITGPHGSGKSTLLAALMHSLKRNRFSIEHHILRDNQSRLTLESGMPASNSVFIVDGYEQLSIWSRWRLSRHIRRFDRKLIVTAHRDVGFTTLYETRVNPEIVRRVVSQLVGDAHDYNSRELIEKLLEKHGQNLREMLFELFDIWRSQSRQSPEGSSPLG